MTTATLSSKFQLVIPKAVRDDMGYQAGQRFVLVEKGESVVLVPIGGIAELQGMLKGADTSGVRDHGDRV